MMRKIAVAAATAAALLIAPGVQAREKLNGEQQLAKLLDGRVAGDPVSCISMIGNQDSRVIDKTAIVFGSGNTIYVNRPKHAEDLDSDDVMVMKLTSSQLCNLDVVQMHDRSTHMYSGFVGLEDFVPYRRVAKAN